MQHRCGWCEIKISALRKKISNYCSECAKRLSYDGGPHVTKGSRRNAK